MIKKRNLIAKFLQDKRYKQIIIKNKKSYNRKSKYKLKED